MTFITSLRTIESAEMATSRNGRSVPVEALDGSSGRYLPFLKSHGLVVETPDMGIRLTCKGRSALSVLS